MRNLGSVPGIPMPVPAPTPTGAVLGFVILRTGWSGRVVVVVGFAVG